MSTNIFLMTADKELVAKVKTALTDLPVKLTGHSAYIKETMETYRSQPARIVIVDMFLPESTGLDALKSLKKLDETVHVVLISRIRGRLLLEKAFRHGAADVLIHPCSAEAIKQTVLHRLDRLESDALIVFQQQQGE